MRYLILAHYPGRTEKCEIVAYSIAETEEILAEYQDAIDNADWDGATPPTLSYEPKDEGDES